MSVLKKFNSNPWYLAITITLLVVLWMVSGGEPEQPAGAEQHAEKAAAQQEVRARHQVAEAVQRYITVYGRSQPSREVTLKAETVGVIRNVHADRGSYVKAGENIATIDVRDRREQLASAKANVEKARIQYEAEQRLKGESLSSDVRLAESMAALETAKAEMKRMQIDLDNIAVKAPFDGSLQERLVEAGDYMKVGDPVAEFVDIDTLIITGSVSETERANLEIGSEASAQLITGQKAVGTLRYIAPVADEATRTFLIELEVDNKDHSLPAGVTAEIQLPVGETFAHRISPAILTLDSDGEIGIKTVNDENTVVFTKIDIVKSTGDGVWIAGLPNQADIITVGQGFVKPGEIVKPVYEPATDVSLAGGEE